MDRLSRQDVVEKRAKCVVCGYELTYPEYINDDKCMFHSKKRLQMGCIGFLRFALAEYRVMQLKRRMVKRGLTEQDFQACVGMFSEDIGKVKEPTEMEALCKELRNYRV